MTENHPVKHGVHFDRTINLGHVMTASASLLMIVVGYVTLNNTQQQQARDIARNEKAIELAMPRTEAKTIETVIIDKIADAKAKTDQTNVRMEDLTREIKASLVRIEVKLDTKADKPERR